MLLLKDKVCYLTGQVQTVLREEGVLHHNQLIGTPILYQPIFDNFHSLLKVTCRIGLLLTVA